MALPINLYTNVVVNWVIPPGITSVVYDTINIYRSSMEAQNYDLMASIPFLSGGNPQTSYTDASQGITTKGTVFYTVIFSNSLTGAYNGPYLAYKALTPREQRLVLQLRDSLSRFISNTLADEEIRQYLEGAIQGVNVYSPTTSFTFFDLPQSLEPLVLLGGLIFGASMNMLRVGFTDIQYSDQGWSLNANRMDKMGQTFDRVLKMYNELLAIAKLDYAEGPQSITTLMVPWGMGNKLGNILEIFSILGSAGR